MLDIEFPSPYGVVSFNHDGIKRPYESVAPQVSVPLRGSQFQSDKFDFVLGIKREA